MTKSLKTFLIMDYEKKYKEAFERAKEVHNEHKAQPFDVMLKVFPELKESEDERTRKCIGDVIREYDWSHIFGVTKDDCLAWIEKQAEQKPTDEEIKTLLRTEYEKGRADAIAEMQNLAWSEEDEHRVKDTIYFLDTAKKHYASTVELDACID